MTGISGSASARGAGPWEGRAGTSGRSPDGGATVVGSRALISCPHGGTAHPLTSAATDAVLLDGVPVATAAHTYVVTGCTHTVNRLPLPCTSVRWAADGDGVHIDGVPVLLDRSAAQCFTAELVPQGPPVVAPVTEGVRAG